MLFEFCKCPKCGNKFLPDFDLTIDHYVDNEYKTKVVVSSEIPPTLPKYFIFQCENPHCSYTEKKDDLETIQMAREGWAQLAWDRLKWENAHAANFEGFLTNYFLGTGFNKAIHTRDMERNPLLKDYINLIENEKKKYIK